MSETTLSKAICASLRATGADVQRIEDKLSSGVPDINVCFHGDFWIELKEGARTTKGNFRIQFRPYQLPWLCRRIRAGGACFVIVRDKLSLNVYAFDNSGIEYVLNKYCNNKHTVSVPFSELKRSACAVGTVENVVSAITRKRKVLSYVGI